MEAPKKKSKRPAGLTKLDYTEDIQKADTETLGNE
jgi:hypothetical protein